MTDEVIEDLAAYIKTLGVPLTNNGNSLAREGDKIQYFGPKIANGSVYYLRVNPVDQTDLKVFESEYKFFTPAGIRTGLKDLRGKGRDLEGGFYRTPGAGRP